MKTNRLTLQIIFYIFLTVPGTGQDIEGILQAIDINNPYLIAERNYSMAKNLEYRTGLTPVNPSISYGYFPGNKAAPGTKKTLGSAKAAALSEVKIRKALSLPSFELGYGSEEIVSEAFRGARVGMTIPLWENKNKVKMAEARVDYTSSLEESVITEFTSEIKQDYVLAETLKTNLGEYITALDDLNDHEILKKSLDLGQMSGIEYFLEVAYYYQTVDLYLDTELEYQLVLARLYKYEL